MVGVYVENESQTVKDNHHYSVLNKNQQMKYRDISPDQIFPYNPSSGNDIAHIC